MVPICVDCWNRLNGTQYHEKNVSTRPERCPCCGGPGPVIVDRRFRLLYRLSALRGALEERARQQGG